MTTSTEHPDQSDHPERVLLDRARAWAALDPDPATADEVRGLVDAAEGGDDAALDELSLLFTGRIAFGTAGLRATLGAGPNRMNELVVRQTTAGLMRWLPDEATVVIGYDARHGSHRFAHATADEVAAAGGRAEIIDAPLPTPVLANAVLVRRADAGVMITASHNPPADNGYKLYLADGIQLVSPADAEIAAAIDGVAALGAPSPVGDRGTIVTLGPEIVDHHIETACAALATDERSVSVVYTAMHGVGGAHVMRAFAAAGFEPPHVVAAQFEPDPDFPTASFPNPEEAGALDLALAEARRVGADVVLANDPDADRLAMAVPGRSGEDWVALSGDEIGVLLADHLIRHRVAVDHPGGRVVANSMVSSRMLGLMAAANGIEAITTLTGFKWVARPIVERPESHYLLGYEEAIGYCVGGRVRDKDGVSAALVAAEMVAGLRAAGTTVWDRLDALAIEHGVHETGPVTIRFDGADGTETRSRLMQRITDEPPAALGGHELTSREDLSEGRRFPPTTGVELHYGEVRVIVRPSGTEPKLKAYVEVRNPVAAGDLTSARTEAESTLALVQDELRGFFERV